MKQYHLNHKRFSGIPGVSYPQIKPGYDPKTGAPYKQKPAWGITSAEAAGILHCSTAAARLSLSRQKVKFCLVSPAKSKLQKYWSKAQVERVAAARLPICRHTPPNTLSPQETMQKLGVSRTTIRRYVEQNLLHAIPIRLYTPRGSREFHYFRKRDVELLNQAKASWQRLGAPTTSLKSIWYMLKKTHRKASIRKSVNT